MANPRIAPQDFQPAQRPKRKRGPLPSTSGAAPSFFSPNQFAVLSDSESDNEQNKAPTQSQDRTPRIPPIVLYSLLNNHSTTLKQLNEKLTTPVDVKSKTDRLLLYTKSSSDYNILLSEIKSAKLAYHTYPLPEAVQPRLVLKGIPTNVPEEDVRADLEAHNIQVVKISQLSKTDRVSRAIITKYPIFIITFSPGTDMCKVLQIHKLCNCIVKWEKYKNSRPVRQCFNCQSFGHSSAFCGKPSKCVKCDQPHASKDCSKPVGTPPKCVNCGGDHPANFTGCPQYLQQLHHSQRKTNQQQRQMRTPKLTLPPFRNHQAHFPALKTTHPLPNPPHTWADKAAQSTNTQNQQPLSSVLDSIKSIFAMFDFHKLCIQLRLLAIQLQESNDPITKLVAVIDTVVGCFSPSP